MAADLLYALGIAAMVVGLDRSVASAKILSAGIVLLGSGIVDWRSARRAVQYFGTGLGYLDVLAVVNYIGVGDALALSNQPRGVGLLMYHWLVVIALYVWWNLAIHRYSSAGTRQLFSRFTVAECVAGAIGIWEVVLLAQHHGAVSGVAVPVWWVFAGFHASILVIWEAVAFRGRRPNRGVMSHR